MLLHQWFKIPKHAYHNSLISLGQVLGEMFPSCNSGVPVTKSADFQAVRKKSYQVLFLTIRKDPVGSGPNLEEGGTKLKKLWMAKRESARLSSIVEEEIAELSSSMDEYSGTTISPSEVARIKAEVRGVMQEQFAQAKVLCQTEK